MRGAGTQGCLRYAYIVEGERKGGTEGEKEGEGARKADLIDWQIDRQADLQKQP